MSSEDAQPPTDVVLAGLPEESRSNAAENDDDDDDVGYIPDDEDLNNLPPGRLHATRVPQRLHGSFGSGLTTGTSVVGGGTMTVPPGLTTTAQQQHHHHHRRSSSGSGGGKDPTSSPRSRSRSPALSRTKDNKVAQPSSGGGTTITGDANSSISSLDDIVDQDILYDRAGLIDDLSQASSSNKKLHNSREGFILTPVTERLSEETLDDVHAFSDAVVRSSNASRAASIGTDREGMALEALDECEEEDDAASLEDASESDLGSGGPSQPQQVILLTNLENLTIREENEEGGGGGGGGGGATTSDDGGGARGTTRGTGGEEEEESSLVVEDGGAGEAPSSGPTA